jgi:hypothetical protein
MFFGAHCPLQATVPACTHTAAELAISLLVDCPELLYAMALHAVSYCLQMSLLRRGKNGAFGSAGDIVVGLFTLQHNTCYSHSTAHVLCNQHSLLLPQQSTAQHNAGQGSTAYRSTAQRTQHSAAQRSSALLRNGYALLCAVCCLLG